MEIPLFSTAKYGCICLKDSGVHQTYAPFFFRSARQFNDRLPDDEPGAVPEKDADVDFVMGIFNGHRLVTGQYQIAFAGLDGF